MRGWRLGVLVLAVTLLNPNVAGAGLVAVSAAYVFARFIQMDATFLDSGFYTYNPLLVGLSIGYLFRLTPLTVFFVVVAGVSAFVLTHMLFSIFWHYLRLPVLSLPFVLVSSTAYLAAASYTNLYVTGLYPQTFTAWEEAIPWWLGGFFESLGAIFFMPHVIAGALFAAGLLLVSRILFLLAVTGYYAGALTLAWMGGSYAQAFGNLNTFNFILIAMAVGGVFLIPSLRSYTLALVAVVASTVLMSSSEVFWALYNLPIFALPFNVVTLSFVYVLGIVSFPLVARGAPGTPEQMLDEYVCNQRRYPGTLRTLGLPFSGVWTVWQGFEGRWTHQGPWAYAYDFVITGADGKTYRGDGVKLEEYHAFRKPVLAPVRGRVVRVVRDLPDNPVGEGDRTHNWGNLVVISDERGFFVELSHFAEDSIRVEEGDWIERGAVLGLCGNSGYSPQPHIHVQVQGTDQVGATTLPFSFVSYAVGDRYHANDVPSEGADVEPLFPDKGLESRMGFVLDEEFTYDVMRDGEEAQRALFVVRMAPDGTFFLESKRGRLYFGTFEDTFYFYRLEGGDPYLRAPFLALPRMPLAYRKGLEWTDHVPVGLVSRGLRKAGIRLLRSLHHGLGQVAVSSRFVSERSIEGQVRSPLLGITKSTRVVLDPHRGVERIQIDDLIMERVHEAPSAEA